MKSSLNIAGIIPRALRRSGPGKEISQKLNKLRNKFRLKNIAASLLYSQTPKEDDSNETDGISQLRTAIPKLPDLLKNVESSVQIKKEKNTRISRKKTKNKNPLVTKVSPSSTQPVKKGDSIADAISKMYTLMRKAYDEKLRQEELAMDFEKERRTEAERKHNEFIKALKALKITVGGVTLSSAEQEPSSLNIPPLPDLPEGRSKPGTSGRGGRIGLSGLAKLGAATTAAAITIAEAKVLDTSMKSRANESIDSIMKDVTIRLSKSSLTPEQKIEEYQKAIRTAMENQTNPSRAAYIEKQLQTSEGLTPQEKEIAKNYFISQKGTKIEPTPEGEKFVPKFQQEVKPPKTSAPPIPAKTGAVSKLIKENNQLTMERQSSSSTPVIVNNNNTSGTIGKEPPPPLPEMKVRTDDNTLNQVIRKLLRPV